MNIQKISIEKIFPNDWNPNHIKHAHYDKLKRFIQKEGAILPIVIRQHPTKKSAYQIIDGYHRWQIWKELGYAEVEAVVVEAADDRARILTVNLNYLRGQAKPREYAKLIHDLEELHTIDDLAQILPDDKPALLDRLELLQLPETLDRELRSQAEEADKEKLSTIMFQVTDEQKDIIESALEIVDSRKKGKALTELVKAGSEAIRGATPAQSSLTT
jgi:ParB family chromosome partitioning protein